MLAVGLQIQPHRSSRCSRIRSLCGCRLVQTHSPPLMGSCLRQKTTATTSPGMRRPSGAPRPQRPGSLCFHFARLYHYCLGVSGPHDSVMGHSDESVMPLWDIAPQALDLFDLYRGMVRHIVVELNLCMTSPSTPGPYLLCSAEDLVLLLGTQNWERRPLNFK